MAFCGEQICGAGRKAIPSREMMFLDEENVLVYKIKAIMCWVEKIHKVRWLWNKREEHQCQLAEIQWLKLVYFGSNCRGPLDLMEKES